MPQQADLQVISGRLDRGEIDGSEYLAQLTRFVATQIGCSRAGVRVLIDTPAGRSLRCVAMYDATLGRMTGAADIRNADQGPYFERLLQEGCVTVMHAGSDRVTSGLLVDYLLPANVSSLMDMCFSVNGVLFGTFSCEQVGAPVDWSQRQLQSLRKIASRASLSLVHAVSAQVDTAPGALWEISTPNRLATMPMPLNLQPG
jgi:hypothetical protein